MHEYHKNKIIRVQSDNDFINLKNNSSDSHEYLKSKFITANPYWENYHSFMAQKFNDSKYHFDNTKTWIKNLDEYNKTSTMFPTIEDTAVKFINRNIFQNSLLPQSFEYFDLSSLLPHNISLVVSDLPQSDIEFTYPSINTKFLKPLPISKNEFKVLRILDPFHNIFVDLKTRAMSEGEINFHMFNIPYFLRDYHLVSRTRIVDNAHDNIDYEFNNHLLKFYNPSKDFVFNEQNSIVYDNQIQKLQIPPSVSKDFSFLHLANYLMFMRPGLFLPLTYRETKWSVHEPADYTMIVAPSTAPSTAPTNIESPIHLIQSLSYSKSNDQLSSFLKNFTSRVKYSDDIFKYKNHSIEKAMSKSLVLLMHDQSLYYVFEYSLICAFQILSAFDNAYDDPTI